MDKESEHIIKVSASDSSFELNLKEIYNYRDLFFVLAYRDLRIRYAQALLGLTWALIQPLITLIVISIVFGKFVQINTGGVPYPVFAIPGIALWTYFSFVLSQAGNSVIGAQEMIKKIYFPRLIIPLSKAVVGLVDFLVAIVLLILLFIYYGYIPSGNIIYAPVFILLAIVTSLAIGVWLSALTIRYRDIQYIIPFFIQFGLYITPIAYSTESVIARVPSWAISIYYLNPMAGIIEGFRWCLIGGELHPEYYAFSFIFVFTLFVSGLFYFRKTEKEMADIL